MHEIYPTLPWHVSFSYGKALQKTCIVTWMGEAANNGAAQAALKARCEANTAAVNGARSHRRSLLKPPPPPLPSHARWPSPASSLLPPPSSPAPLVGTYVAGTCASVGLDGNIAQAAGPY